MPLIHGVLLKSRPVSVLLARLAWSLTGWGKNVTFGGFRAFDVLIILASYTIIFDVHILKVNIICVQSFLSCRYNQTGWCK